MNFIIKLFKLKNLTMKIQYDCILIIINKIIKYLHVLLYKEKYQNEYKLYIIKLASLSFRNTIIESSSQNLNF